MYEFILQKSSLPFISILKKWIFEGILDDHFHEFIVKENTELKKVLDDLGMNMVSSHCEVTKDFDRKAAEAAEIGMKYLIFMIRQL